MSAERGKRPTAARSAPADPILAAIEIHRRKLADFEAQCEEPKSEKEYYRLMRAEDKAALALTTTRPTTIAGAVALMRYVADRAGASYPFAEETHQTWPGMILANVATALAARA